MSIKQVFLFSFFVCVSTVFSNGLVLHQTNDWVGRENGSAQIENHTINSWMVRGFRANITDRVTNPVAFDPLRTPTEIDDGNTRENHSRWEIELSGAANNRNINPGEARSFSINPNLAWDDTDTDWNPRDEQWLVKIGSFSGERRFLDIDSLSIDSLRILVQQDWFYDPDIYIPDTLLGERGGPVSAGVINTWYDQEADSALWQIQMCETEVFQQNGEWVFFNPFIMGQQHPDWGPGPMYAMGLAMVPEYFNLDYQLMLASATNESMAGLERAENITDWETGAGATPSGISAYHTANVDTEMGTNHWEEPTYQDVIWGGYRRYFPFDETYTHSSKYATTPGTNDCVGNSPQVVNAQLINSVYFWYSFELFFNATQFYADYAFRNAEDREMAAKMFLAMWNGGRNSIDDFLNNLMETHMHNPNITGDDLGNDYIELVYRAVNPLQEGSRNSVANGGDKEIFDYPITLEHVEWFFFGDGGEPENGQLGAAGILHHFDLNDEERIDIWETVTTAYDILNNQGPFSDEGAISFRYDFLALMRVVKGDIDLRFPTPTNSDFVTWVDRFSRYSVIEDYDGPVIDSIYPHLRHAGRRVENDMLIITMEIEDKTYIDIDSLETVQWTADRNWDSWHDAHLVSGDTLFATYEVRIPREQVEDIAGGDVVQAWVRGFDRNYNAVIDTFSLYWETPPEPHIREAWARDISGDGMADVIEVTLEESSSPHADPLDSFDDPRYSWPEPTTITSADNADLTNNILTLTDSDLSDGHGVGRVLLSYPSGEISGSVLDGVGPALRRTPQPTYYMPANDTEEDTLLLQFTEPIADLNSDEAHLSFKDMDGNTENITTREVREENGEYTFIFDHHTVLPYDSVRINPAGPVRDRAEEPNSAEEYNLWRPIRSIGDNDPEFDEAYHQDTEGDGMGDQIFYLFEIANGNDPFNHTHITHVTYEIDGQDVTVQPDDGEVTIETAGNTVRIIIDTDDISGDATGIATVFFNKDGEKTELTGPVDDRVGPAVEEGDDLPLYRIPDLSQEDQVDTFQLAFTEPITGFAAGEPILAFRGNDRDSTTLEATEISETGGIYTALFPAESLSDFTHVKINSESALRDRAEDPNPAEEYNQWVAFDRQGNNDPEFIEAYLEDNVGDGRGDRIIKEFALSQGGDDPFTEEHVTTVSYSIDGVDETLPWDDLEITRDADTVTVSLPVDNFPGDATGQGIIYFEKPDGATHRLATNITDAVGPAVEEENQLPLYRIPDPRQDNQVDTFQVAFTEAVSDLSNNGTYLAFRGNPGDSTALAAEEISREDDFFTVFFAARALENFSEVKIVHESDLRDMANNPNPAAEYNQWVPFQRQGNNDPEFVEGYLEDTRGDGRGDGIIYLFEISRGGDNPFTESHITEINYSVNGTDETLSADNIAISRTDYRVRIHIDEVDFDGAASGEGSISFYNDGTLFELPVHIEDRVGPALTGVMCLQEDEDRDRDTLFFDVSEALADDISSEGTYFYIYKGAEDGPQKA
ncbi:hypothetical protein, partial [Chitinivibrio alkaliphilus]|uniref:hypothetical protein n=1 Tax=Chitinivibrio alkaliphilus TaxID=1505232 RepID=UPI000556EBFC